MLTENKREQLHLILTLECWEDSGEKKERVKLMRLEEPCFIHFFSFSALLSLLTLDFPREIYDGALLIPAHSLFICNPSWLLDKPAPCSCAPESISPAFSGTVCHKFSSHYITLSRTSLQSVRLYWSLTHLSTNVLRFSLCLIFNPASPPIAMFSFLGNRKGKHCEEYIIFLTGPVLEGLII